MISHVCLTSLMKKNYIFRHKFPTSELANQILWQWDLQYIEDLMCFFFRPLLREMGNPWYSSRKLLHHCNDAYLVRLWYSRGSQLQPSFRCCWEKRNSHEALVVRWDNFCNVWITLVWSTKHNQPLIIETIKVSTNDDHSLLHPFTSRSD